MFGSMAGNLMGILYFLLFQFMGIMIVSLFLKKEKWGFTLLAGMKRKSLPCRQSMACQHNGGKQKDRDQKQDNGIVKDPLLK